MILKLFALQLLFNHIGIEGIGVKLRTTIEETLKELKELDAMLEEYEVNSTQEESSVPPIDVPNKSISDGSSKETIGEMTDKTYCAMEMKGNIKSKMPSKYQWLVTVSAEL